jgi:site-specific recombinase XerC
MEDEMSMQNKQSQPLSEETIETATAKQGAEAQERVAVYLKSLSAKTRRRHKDELKVLRKYLADVRNIPVSGNLETDLTPWRVLTKEQVLDFVEWMRMQGYAQESIITCLYTIKTYCRMASEAEILSAYEYGRIQGIRLVKDKQQAPGNALVPSRPLSKKKLIPLNISEQQAECLLRQPNTPQGARDELLLCLLLLQGLWPTEIATLPADAIDLEARTLTVYRTLAREKQVHMLMDETRTAARRYLSFCSPSTLLLMGSRKGGHLTGHVTDRAIHDRVRALGARVGLPTLSPQDCHRYWEQSTQRTSSQEKPLPVSRTPALTSRRVKTQSDLFNRQAFEESLSHQGVPAQALSSLISDFRLFVPLLIKAIGEEQFLEIVAKSSADLRLSSQPESWRATIKYLVEWAQEEIRLYVPMEERSGETPSPPSLWEER